MTLEPRHREDYGPRETEAARRVLVDLGQVLASFADCLAIVGGWVPELLIPEAEEPHIGSIDVDLALDAGKLHDGRYADLIQLLLDTRRYRLGEDPNKPFQLLVDVDLGDGFPPVRVDVEFLAPKQVKLKRGANKRIAGFRVLQTEGSDVAFSAPVEQTLSGRNVLGAENTVRLHVTSLADFLVMKALALGGRDKPKDAYDFCYCLRYAPEGLDLLAKIWRERVPNRLRQTSLTILREKFRTVDSFGPRQVVEFHASASADERAIQAREAFELVAKFLDHSD